MLKEALQVQLRIFQGLPRSTSLAPLTIMRGQVQKPQEQLLPIPWNP